MAEKAEGKVYSRQELEQGLKAMASLVQKSEKALSHLLPGSSQHTLLSRRLAAFILARDLILEKLAGQEPAGR